MPCGGSWKERRQFDVYHSADVDFCDGNDPDARRDALHRDVAEKIQKKQKKITAPSGTGAAHEKEKDIMSKNSITDSAKKVKVYRKTPFGDTKIFYIPNTLEEFQMAVGGYIETFQISQDLTVICDEEGRLKGLPYNVTILGEPLFGTILFVGISGEEFCDAPDPKIMREIFGEKLFPREMEVVRFDK